MRWAVLGAGAVGGYYGAKLAAAGEEVTFLARGAHLDAIREHGLAVRSPLGDFVAPAAAEEDPARVGAVDAVIFSVKTYDNRDALPMLKALMREGTTVLTLQNGVDSADEVAAVTGRQAVLAGATYIATARSAPGLIEQTGTHQRIVFGEVFDAPPAITPRVERLAAALTAAGVEIETAADARVPLWEKFIYLAPFAAFTGAARLPIGRLWGDPDARAQFMAAAAEVEMVARAEGVAVGHDLRERILRYMEELPGATRSSLLIDLSAGKRTEVEALQGSVVRRGRACGVATPIMAALYAVLKPWGTPSP